MQQNGHSNFSLQSKKERKLTFNGVVLGALSSALLLLPTSLLAQQCGVGAAPDKCHCQPTIMSFPNNTIEGGENGKIPVLLEADDVEADGEDSVTLSGGAYVAQGRQSISGGTITYSRATDKIKAVGGIKLRSVAGDSVEADTVDLDVNRKLGTATNAKFKLAERGQIDPETNAVVMQSRGTAEEISLEGEQFVRMSDVKYTTCAEGQEDFFVKAGELEIDQATGMAKAKNASIIFKGVPLLYLPTITFPINDQRKSGFLFPSFGTDSESGFVIEAPWYWNIAPNVDATITPRILTDRGVQLGVEVRHKTEQGETLFYGEHLPSDDLASDEDRTMFALRHDSDIGENVSVDVDFNDVSDIRYFEDFGSEVGRVSSVYVPRSAKLNYSADYWNASLGYSDYQIVDDSVNVSGQPFERRPELSFSTNLPKTGLVQVDVAASATNFAHEDATKDQGWRYVVEPKVSAPMEKVWGYVTPAVQLKNVSYSIDNRDVDSRTTPILSVDSGLYLEKDTSFFGESVTQTLEPRALFLYRDADTIAAGDQVDFDTESVRFNNFNSLYSSTGFTGDDQVADGQQVTLALTTRMFNEDGNQRLKASIGQAFYSDDREISRFKDGALVTETRDKSDLLGELTLDLGNSWQIDTFLQYDTEESELSTTNLNARYAESTDKYIEFGYRKSNDSALDQLVVEGEWPISPNMSLFGVERYGLEESENLQTRLGFEYDACCWRLRVSADSLRRSNQETRNAIFAEFELTGLGKVNTSTGF